MVRTREILTIHKTHKKKIKKENINKRCRSMEGKLNCYRVLGEFWVIAVGYQQAESSAPKNSIE